jgi:hypothetical protein
VVGRLLGSVVPFLLVSHVVTEAGLAAALGNFAGRVAYVWHPALRGRAVQRVILQTGFDLRAQIIRPSSGGETAGAYAVGHEQCWYSVRKGSAKWCRDRSQSTYWDLDDGAEGRPIECMARPIRNHGKAADDVYDPFLQGGATLLAAEQLGRRCFGVEEDPAQCVKVLARWAALTGKKPVRSRGIVAAA